MDVCWTFPELVAQAAAAIAALPAPANGQVRAVPDERTIRYYGTIGLLDRPLAMRGRTALYGRRHLAQVIAIKRLQTAGRSLAEIQALWPTLDDANLARMAGIEIGGKGRGARKEFWKQDADPNVEVAPARPRPRAPSASPELEPVELRVPLTSTSVLSLSITGELSLTPADVRALRAAAAPLIAELARRGLTPHNQELP